MNNSKTKILYIINNFSMGGAEKMLLDLCSHIDKSKFEVAVATVNGGGVLLEDFQKLGITLYINEKKGKISLGSISKLRRVIRDFNPTIIHTHLFAGDTWGRIAAMLEGAPYVVMTEHNQNLNEGFIKKSVKHFLSYMTSVIVAVSQQVADYDAKKELISDKKFEVIQNGIEVKKFPFRGVKIKRYGDAGITLLSVGRLVEQKGHIYALEALAKLSQEDLDVRLVILGDGELREDLEHAVKSLRISDRVAFVGTQKDTASYLTSSDIFVFPSLFEGQGIVLLEAMSVGVPIIASDIPAVNGLIRDGVTGALFEPRDSDALAAAVKKLLMDVAAQERYITAAREVVTNHFSVAGMVKSYESLYEKMLANPQHYALRFTRKQ
ncbi:glycosyltransferase [Candidatus Falkowbacteria bacterium]|nr:glycosyltransferase [Candidatus Falkowbacteria bacterium]